MRDWIASKPSLWLLQDYSMDQGCGSRAPKISLSYSLTMVLKEKTGSYFNPPFLFIGSENASDKSRGQRSLERHPSQEPGIWIFGAMLWSTGLQPRHASEPSAKPGDLTDVTAAVEKVTPAGWLVCLRKNWQSSTCIAWKQDQEVQMAGREANLYSYGQCSPCLARGTEKKKQGLISP